MKQVEIAEEPRGRRAGKEAGKTTSPPDKEKPPKRGNKRGGEGERKRDGVTTRISATGENTTRSW